MGKGGGEEARVCENSDKGCGRGGGVRLGCNIFQNKVLFLGKSDG